jgi:transcriptional regulator with XRE-family HTH domain
MSNKSIISGALASIRPETRIFTRKLAYIVMRVEQLMAAKGWTQKDLAQAMGKQESEISKWLNTPHNLTLKSIAKLEAALGEEIVIIPGISPQGQPTAYLDLTTLNNAQLNEAPQEYQSPDTKS